MSRIHDRSQQTVRRLHGRPDRSGARFLAATALVIVVVQGLCAQDRTDVIELRHADVLKGGTGVRELIGDVRFQQLLREGGTVRVWTDRALQYLEDERLEMFGRVRILRDSTTLTADEGRYYGADRRADVSGNVRLERSGSVVTSSAGEYFPDERRVLFLSNVRVVDTASIITCDRLEYWEDDDRSVATGHVKVVQRADETTVFGDSLESRGAENRAIVTGSPRLIQVDTSSAGEIDTLLVESERMESSGDSVRILIATGRVRMARSNLAATCERATFLVAADSIALAGSPIVWHEGNQLTGDSISIRLKDRRLDRVLVRGHAMAVSRADSARKARFDQLTGRNLTMYFSDGKVRTIDAEQTATSLYYLYDERTPNGMNVSSGDRIVIEFSEGSTERIRVLRGVEGKYYPERMIGFREDEYNLDGFRWFTSRPVREGMQLKMKDIP